MKPGKTGYIYIGGSYEIRHLGNSIQSSYEENRASDEKIMERTE